VSETTGEASHELLADVTLCSVAFGNLVRNLRRLPIAVGIFVVVTALPLGMSRDFFAFLVVAFAYVPLLAIAALLAIAWLIIERVPSRRASIAWALLAIAAAAPLYFIGNRFSDPIRFVFWTPLHPVLLARYSSRDGIVTEWDSWGFGGMENDAYLVADHGPAISSNDAATAWIARHGGKCEIVDVERMWPSLYILTTSECVL
jgi:hypothetical protein